MHPKLLGLIAAWLASRAWVLLSGFQILPYPEGANLFADVRLYDWWAGNIQDGHFPINDPMWQYPPLAALVFLFGYLIAPQTVGFVFLATAADALIFYFLLEAGQSRPDKKYLPAAIWVSTAIFMGPVMLGRFDVFPTLFAVLALVFIQNNKYFGVNVAIGAILKVWPILLLVAIPKSRFKSVLAWFALSFGLLALALTIWWPNSFSFLVGQQSRGLQIESFGALAFMIWNAIADPLLLEFRYGAVEVLAAGVNLVSLLITVVGFVFIGQVIFWRIKGKLEKVEPSLIALYLVMLSMVTSRVLSPQYMVWLFGLLAVCALATIQKFNLIFWLIAASAFAGQLIYPVFYYSYMSGELLALLIQILRLTTLLAATFLVWQNLQSQKNESAADLVRN